MMEPDTLRLVRGTTDLVTDAVGGAVDGIGEAHQAMVRQIYAPFSLLGPLALPVQLIELIQTAITSAVYETIRGVNQLVALGATVVIDDLEARAPGSDRSGPGGSAA